jgi:adenylate cyclase
MRTSVWLLLAGALAAQISWVLAFVAVIATWLACFRRGNRITQPKVQGRKREANDQHLFRTCGSGSLGRFRQGLRRIPSDPRCRLCLIPFSGVGKILGGQPNSKNPNLCRSCFEAAPTGSYDQRVGILFADIRGFTKWSEDHTPGEAADLLSRFYAIANRELTQDDALVEFVGDQVMAIYLEIFPSIGQANAALMVAAGTRLLNALTRSGFSNELGVGIGLHLGTAAVGNIEKGDVRDFTAAGDVVNTAARLQSSALAGQIVMSQDVFASSGGPEFETEQAELMLKGKQEPMPVRILRVD